MGEISSDIPGNSGHWQQSGLQLVHFPSNFDAPTEFLSSIQLREASFLFFYSGLDSFVDVNGYLPGSAFPGCLHLFGV